jgi:hypothetical protein
MSLREVRSSTATMRPCGPAATREMTVHDLARSFSGSFPLEVRIG